MYQNNYNGIYNPQQMFKPGNTSTNIPGVAGGLKGRPVSSLEEARAATIDFDGSVFFFPDIANKKIYTKQINLDGTASLNMYEFKEIPMESNGNNYVTRQEFDQTLTEIKNSLAQLMPQQTPIPKEDEQNAAKQSATSQF